MRTSKYAVRTSKYAVRSSSMQCALVNMQCALVNMQCAVKIWKEKSFICHKNTFGKVGTPNIHQIGIDILEHKVLCLIAEFRKKHGCSFRDC